MSNWTQQAQVLANKHEQEWMSLISEMEEQIVFEIEKRNRAETALIVLWGVADESKIPDHQRVLVMSAIVNSGGYYGTSYVAKLQKRLDELMEKDPMSRRYIAATVAALHERNKHNQYGVESEGPTPYVPKWPLASGKCHLCGGSYALRPAEYDGVKVLECRECRKIAREAAESNLPT